MAPNKPIIPHLRPHPTSQTHPVWKQDAASPVLFRWPRFVLLQWLWAAFTARPLGKGINVLRSVICCATVTISERSCPFNGDLHTDYRRLKTNRSKQKVSSSRCQQTAAVHQPETLADIKRSATADCEGFETCANIRLFCSWQILL